MIRIKNFSNSAAYKGAVLGLFMINFLSPSQACDFPAFNENADRSYAQGEVISRNGIDYEVLVPGWANSFGSDWAYAPGTGSYWDQAWKKLSDPCQNTNSADVNNSNIWSTDGVDRVEVHEKVTQIDLESNVSISGTLDVKGTGIIKDDNPSFVIQDESNNNENRMEIKADQSGTSFRGNYKESGNGISMKFFNNSSTVPTLDLGNAPTNGYRATVNGELMVTKTSPTLIVQDDSDINLNRMIIKADQEGTSFRGTYSDHGTGISMRFFNNNSTTPTFALENAEGGGYQAVVNGATVMNGKMNLSGEATINGNARTYGNSFVYGDLRVFDGNSSPFNPALRFEASDEEGVTVINGSTNARNKAFKVKSTRSSSATGHDHYAFHSEMVGDGWAGFFEGRVGIDGNQLFGAGTNKMALFPYSSGDLHIVPNQPSSVTEFEWGKTTIFRNNGEMVKMIDSDDKKALSVRRHGADDVFRVMGSGKVYATELNVRLSEDFPDYVFEEDYDLMPLSDLKNYINKEKHLPGVPKASIVEKEGMNVSELNRVLVEKVEELTLYTLEQQELIEQLVKEVKELKKL